MSLLLEAQADPNLQDNEVRSMLTSVLGQLMLMGSLLHSFIIKSLVLVIKQIFNKINLLTRIWQILMLILTGSDILLYI